MTTYHLINQSNGDIETYPTFFTGILGLKLVALLADSGAISEQLSLEPVRVTSPESPTGALRCCDVQSLANWFIWEGK